MGLSARFGNYTERPRLAPSFLFRDSSMVERPAVNRKVLGSTPSPGALRLFRRLIMIDVYLDWGSWLFGFYISPNVKSFHLGPLVIISSKIT